MKESRWIVKGISAVDDSTYGPRTYEDHPSHLDLVALAEEWGGPAGSDGPGDYGTNVNLNIELVNIEVK